MLNTTKKTVQILLIFILAFTFDSAAEAASLRRDVKEGNLHYEKGDYAASREKYAEALKKDPESDIVNFNLGTALYKEKDYEAAVDPLQKVLLSEDDQLKEKAYYNLGNALYQSGILHAQDDMGQAISSLEKSLSQYQRALSMDAEDKDAKHNYDFVQKELLRLKEQQQKQQQQKQDQPQPESSKDQQKEQEPQGSEEKQESQKQEQKQQQQQQQQQNTESQEQQKQETGGEEQQAQEQKTKQEEESGEGRGQESKESYNKQQEGEAQPQDARELTPKEAQMLLESYRQAEEPQGLLNVHQERIDTEPVFKDW